MLRQHIKNYTALSLYLLLATSSFTLNGMSALTFIKNGTTALKDIYDQLKNGVIISHDAILYNADLQLSNVGYVVSSLVALSIPAHIVYTNPHALSTLLDTQIVNETIKIAQNSTPRIFFKAIDTLNVINKNYIIYGLKTSINNALSYQFRKFNSTKSGLSYTYVASVHPSSWFTDSPYHAKTVSFTTNLITIASLAYLFYSAWYGNPEAKWKALATTAGLQFWIRYALHMAALKKQANNDELIARIAAKYKKPELTGD